MVPYGKDLKNPDREPYAGHGEKEADNFRSSRRQDNGSHPNSKHTGYPADYSCDSLRLGCSFDNPAVPSDLDGHKIVENDRHLSHDRNYVRDIDDIPNRHGPGGEYQNRGDQDTVKEHLNLVSRNFLLHPVHKVADE